MFATRTFRLRHTADILGIPSGNDPDARTVVATVACSSVYPASAEQMERAGLATNARLMVVYCAPSNEARPDRKVQTLATEYRIRAVTNWPHDDATRLMELLIEEDV